MRGLWNFFFNRLIPQSSRQVSLQAQEEATISYNWSSFWVMDLSAGRRMKYFHEIRRIPAECAMRKCKSIFFTKNSKIDFYLHKYSQIQGCKPDKGYGTNKNEKKCVDLNCNKTVLILSTYRHTLMHTHAPCES
jgi:hypothetical protein